MRYVEDWRLSKGPLARATRGAGCRPGGIPNRKARFVATKACVDFSGSLTKSLGQLWLGESLFYCETDRVKFGTNQYTIG